MSNPKAKAPTVPAEVSEAINSAIINVEDGTETATETNKPGKVAFKTTDTYGNVIEEH